MAYNLKITEYANGQLEVITYKQGVYTMLDGESSYRADMIDKNADALAWRFASYVIDEKTGEVRCTGESEHCFLDTSGCPVSLKRSLPELNIMFIDMTEN